MFSNNNLKRQFSSKISFQDVDLNKNDMQSNDADSSINESTCYIQIINFKLKEFFCDQKHSQWTMPSKNLALANFNLKLHLSQD